MRIFLASAKLDDIRWATESGLVEGVATTPSMLAAEVADGDGRELLGEICRTAALPVCATVGAINGADIYRDARELARLSESLIVEIPLIEDAVGAIRRLSAEGVHVAASLVFNAAQALLAAKAGAATVSTALDQLDVLGQDSGAVLREIRNVFDRDGSECDLLAAMPKTAAQFSACAVAGADIVTVSTPVLKSLLLHPLTDRGLDQLLSELSKNHKARLAT